MHRARAAIGGNLNPAVDHCLDAGGDLFAQDRSGVLAACQINRVEPVFRFGVALGQDRRPQFHLPRHGGLEGDVVHLAADIAQRRIAEGQIDQPQDRGRRAERIFQLKPLQRRVYFRQLGLK